MFEARTEAINLVAHAWGIGNLNPDDEVLITHMEHHSNIVPWQLICDLTGARLKVVPITDQGELDMDAFDRLLGPKTGLVGVVHVSNALGTINPRARDHPKGSRARDPGPARRRAGPLRGCR